MNDTYFVEQMTDGTYAVLYGPSDYDYIDSARDALNADDKVALIVCENLTREGADNVLADCVAGRI